MPHTHICITTCMAAGLHHAMPCPRNLTECTAARPPCTALPSRRPRSRASRGRWRPAARPRPASCSWCGCCGGNTGARMSRTAPPDRAPAPRWSAQGHTHPHAPHQHATATRPHRVRPMMAGGAVARRLRSVRWMQRPCRPPGWHGIAHRITSRRPVSSGTPMSISRSKRPKRRSAASMELGRLVAAMTITCARLLRPAAHAWMD